MKLCYNNFTFDNNVIESIENNCKQVNAHAFNQYLHECRFGGKPIIQVLKNIKRQKKFIKNDLTETNLKFSIDQQKALVSNFYKSLSFDLGEKAAKILYGRDPRYSVNISQDSTRDCSGNVSSTQNSNTLHFDANVDGGIHGLKILAHETSHALSQFKTKSYDIINSTDENEKEKFFHHLGKYNVDSIMEIESHIIEFLFMDYLQDKNIITKNDMSVFEIRRNNSIVNNLDTVIQESYILDNMSPPITWEKFEKKIGGFIKTKKYKTLMNRLISMYSRDKHSGYSQYDFRYVIGDVVSTTWIEKYTISNTQQKQEMIKSFISYLENSCDHNLETACNDLLGMSIGDTFSDYISQIQSKSTE